MERKELIAYVGANRKDGCGIDRQYGSTHSLTDWHGQQIGYCTLACSWPVNSVYGPRMFQVYAWVNGIEYTGRSFGEGMVVRLFETAASRKKREGLKA